MNVEPDFEIMLWQRFCLMIAGALVYSIAIPVGWRLTSDRAALMVWLIGAATFSVSLLLVFVTRFAWSWGWWL